MGAMQAQDFEMVKWAVGIRASGSDYSSVESAFNNGDIIRTHLLRPTWHLVSSFDIKWMLELTAPRIKASLNSRHKDLGLNKSLIDKSNKIIINALEENGELTRDYILSLFGKAKIDTSGNRAYHLFLMAELEALICSGKIKGKKQTYSLFEKRVPSALSLTKESALKKLALIYFNSRGPAAVHDFIWWSGLSASDAKAALEYVKPALSSKSVNSTEYWFAEDSRAAKMNVDAVRLLPAFDEFMISYKDRTALFGNDKMNKAVSSNGVFRPAVLVNGKVSGIWKRTFNKDNVNVEIELFVNKTNRIKSLVQKSAYRYGKFLGKKAEVFFIKD